MVIFPKNLLESRYLSVSKLNRNASDITNIVTPIHTIFAPNSRNLSSVSVIL